MPVLFANPRRQVFSRRGPNDVYEGLLPFRRLEVHHVITKVQALSAKVLDLSLTTLLKISKGTPDNISQSTSVQ